MNTLQYRHKEIIIKTQKKLIKWMKEVLLYCIKLITVSQNYHDIESLRESN